MFRVAVPVVLAFGVWACAGSSPRPTSPGGTSAGPAAGGAQPPRPVGGGQGPVTVAPAGGLDPAGAACPTPGCVFHGGLMAGAYFACLSSGAGSCFHFGGRCAPVDGCMYDPASRQYRQCADPSEGTCATYGAACQPASACAYDGRDGLYRSCEAWSKGSCARWGALCAP